MFFKQRRKYPRIHTRIEIPFWKYVQFKMGEESYTGFVKNMSSGGFYIETDRVFKKGETISFEFFLPSSSVAISGQAKIMWVRKIEANETEEAMTSGMGLKFSKFDGKGKHILTQYIASEIDKADPKKN